MIKKVALLFDEKKEYNLKIIENAISVLSDCGVQIFLSSKIKNYIKNKSVNFFDDVNIIIPNIDVAIILGGDGSIIYFSKLCAGFNKPVLGINTGKVGFLSTIEKDELDKLKLLVDGKYIVENHFLLEIKYSGRTFLALNEFVVSRNPLLRMLDFEIYKLEEKIFSFRADGVIITTPTGSTAYSLSAGGPIIDNDADCLAITPVCPHEVSCKCMVIPSNCEISIKTQGEVVLNADGVGEFAGLNGEMIKIKKSDFAVKFIKFSKNHLYENIEKKILKRR